MQMRGLRCAAVRAPCVPCTHGPDPAAKIPSDKPSSTSTTVADTSAATSSRWVHLDVALRQMSGAARRRGGRPRSETVRRRRGVRTRYLARDLDERRAARPVRTSPPWDLIQALPLLGIFVRALSQGDYNHRQNSRLAT